MRYRNIIILLALLLQTGVSTLQAQTVSESRTLEKSFLVKEGMTLDVSNKYGKIHLSTSTSDSVFIRIEMNASASKSSKLRKLIDGVAFDLTSTNHFVIAETRFEKGPINFIEGIRNLTNNIISSESKVDIDYYIYAPPYLDIKIDNRYGDVYIESTEADLDIKVVNGDLKAEDLTGNSTFDLNFCDATISSLKNSRISISYGDLNVSKAEAININSSSSKIDFDDIEELHSESKRDKYYIKGLTSLEGNSYFTDYNIDILREKINMTTRYGNVNIESIPPGFSIISLESSYTGVFLTADPETSFLFEAKLNNCNSSIPENWIIEEEALNIEKNEYLYFGDIGQETPSARVILKLTRGKLNFDQNN